MELGIDPLAGSFGARVSHNLIDNDGSLVPDALTAALHRHRLLVFPGQHLNHADLLTAGRLFGDVDTGIDRRYAVPGFPGLTVISNIAEEGSPIGIYDGDDEEEWHADNSFKTELNRATLLYSVITPGTGGETRFADATQAYADLPDSMKRRIRELHAVHSIEQLGIRQAQASGGRSSAASGTLTGTGEVEHPLAPAHPVTRRRSLLIGSMVVKAITGLPAADSDQLLADLLAHATSAPYLLTHRWSQGDLVIWDNRAVLHTASPCDSSRHPRLLYRAAVR